MDVIKKVYKGRQLERVDNGVWGEFMIEELMEYLNRHGVSTRLKGRFSGFLETF